MLFLNSSRRSCVCSSYRSQELRAKKKKRYKKKKKKKMDEEGLTGTRKRRISVRARAIRAWASAGAAYAVISTWRSSLRCLYRGSSEWRYSSSYFEQKKKVTKIKLKLKLKLDFTLCLSRIEPRPRMAILVNVSSCRRLSELPLGPSNLPTKLNWTNSQMWKLNF